MSVLKDAFVDSLMMLPFLLGAYLLLEYMEHRGSEKMAYILSGSRGLGPVVGAALGCVPQCGFSVVAANLYSGGIISLGTLAAVFIATSDEAIPVLLAHPDNWSLIGGLLFIKLLLGTVSGLGVDLFLRRRAGKLGEAPADKPSCPEGAGAAEHAHQHEHCEERGIVASALGHTMNIFMFVLLANVILGGAMELLGQEALSRLLLGGSFWQPVAAAFIGLIPNCAASVVLTSLFLEGTLSFGALTAGLSTGAGVGLMVLLRTNKNQKQNLRIIMLLAAIGSLSGILIQLLVG